MTDPGRVDAAGMHDAVDVVADVLMSGDESAVGALLGAGAAHLEQVTGRRLAPAMSIEDAARADASRARYSGQLQRRVAEGVKEARRG
jgi:hypothetical protein